jgi:hypothetical protein
MEFGVTLDLGCNLAVILVWSSHVNFGNVEGLGGFKVTFYRLFFNVGFG